MYSKHNEIESIVEDLVENVIFELFQGSFENPKECEIALELLINKLEEIDSRVFRGFFDN